MADIIGWLSAMGSGSVSAAFINEWHHEQQQDQSTSHMASQTKEVRKSKEHCGM